jgi:hypothetical protein
MLGSSEIIQLFTGLHSDMQFRAKYNKVLSSLFSEEPFTVAFDEGVEVYTHMTVGADTDGTFLPKPIFILFIIPKCKWFSVARKHAEGMLGKLLGEAETPFEVIHGAIVCGTRITFYRYDRQKRMFAPEPQEQMPSDVNLQEEDGAVQMLKVVEEVKDMEIGLA